MKHRLRGSSHSRTVLESRIAAQRHLLSRLRREVDDLSVQRETLLQKSSSERAREREICARKALPHQPWNVRQEEGGLKEHNGVNGPCVSQDQGRKPSQRKSWTTALESARTQRSEVKRRRQSKVREVREESNRLKRRLHKQREAATFSSTSERIRTVGTSEFRRADLLFHELVAKYKAKSKNVGALSNLVSATVLCLGTFPQVVDIQEQMLLSRNLRQIVQVIALKFAELCRVRRNLLQAQHEQLSALSQAKDLLRNSTTVMSTRGAGARADNVVADHGSFAALFRENASRHNMVQSIIKHSFAVGTGSLKMTMEALTRLEEEFVSVFGSIEGMVVRRGGDAIYNSMSSASDVSANGGALPSHSCSQRMETKKTSTKVFYDNFHITICWKRHEDEKTKVLAALFLRFSLHILLCLSTPGDKILSLAKRLVDLSTVHVGVCTHTLGKNAVRSSILPSFSSRNEGANLICTVVCDPYTKRFENNRVVDGDASIGQDVGNIEEKKVHDERGERGNKAKGKSGVWKKSRDHKTSLFNETLDIYVHGAPSWQHDTVIPHESLLQLKNYSPKSRWVSDILGHHMRTALQKCSDTMLLWKQCNCIYEILGHRKCLVLEIMPEGNLASASRRIGSCGWDASSLFDLSGNKCHFLYTKGAEGVDDGSLQWLGNQEDPCTDLKAPLLGFLSPALGKEVVLGAGVLRQDHAGANENTPSEEEAAILRQVRRVMWRYTRDGRTDWHLLSLALGRSHKQKQGNDVAFLKALATNGSELSLESLRKVWKGNALESLKTLTPVSVCPKTRFRIVRYRGLDGGTRRIFVGLAPEDAL